MHVSMQFMHHSDRQVVTDVHFENSVEKSATVEYDIKLTEILSLLNSICRAHILVCLQGLRIKATVFLGVTPYSSVARYGRIEGTSCQSF